MISDIFEICLWIPLELGRKNVAMFSWTILYIYGGCQRPQASNYITYNGCLSVSTVLMKEHEAKKILKKKVNIFSESHKELFGTTFREDWCSNLKD